MNNITQSDHDNLADIAWFIKGLNFRVDAIEESPFSSSHEESLKNVLRAIKDELNKAKRESK